MRPKFSAHPPANFMQTLLFSSPNFQKQLDRFCAQAADDGDVERVVDEVVERVRREGDAAVLAYTKKFDGVAPAALRVPESAMKASLKALAPRDRARIREAIACVRDFHKKTLPKNWRARNPQGGVVGENFYPIRRVGINVPAGKVPLVSTVVMTTVLAKIAGVPEIAVCTPPQKDGKPDAALLAALQLCGINEVYAMGGIQAMAAFAFGTKTVRRVDKLFGPGNRWVTGAKRRLFGTVGVDLLPGPSEVMVIADKGSNPDWTAADLLSQAEHGTGSEKIYLVVRGRALAARIERALARARAQLPPNPGRDIALERHCLIVVVDDIRDAADIANFIAPEHLELHAEGAALADLSARITTAGAMLLGESTPTAVGDFTAGPSHTLPTGRTGRFFSGLRVADFMRRTSVVRYDEKSLRKAADVVETFSRLERLPAHGRSLFIRLEK